MPTPSPVLVAPAVLLFGCAPGLGPEGTSSDDPAPRAMEPTNPYEGNLWIGSVGQMAEFCAEYDGLTGSLEVVQAQGEDLGALDCLVGVGGFLLISSQPNLLVARLPSLSSVGGSLQLVSLPSLSRFEAPALVEVGGLQLDQTRGPEPLALPSLRTIGEDGLQLTRTSTVETLDLPWLETIEGDFELDENEALSTLEAGRLERIAGDVFIVDNPALTDAAAETFLLGVPGVEGTVTIQGNGLGR